MGPGRWQYSYSLVHVIPLKASSVAGAPAMGWGVGSSAYARRSVHRFPAVENWTGESDVSVSTVLRMLLRVVPGHCDRGGREVGAGSLG
jgi:hypothetical protein